MGKLFRLVKSDVVFPAMLPRQEYLEFMFLCNQHILLKDKEFLFSSRSFAKMLDSRQATKKEIPFRILIRLRNDSLFLLMCVYWRRKLQTEIRHDVQWCRTRKTSGVYGSLFGKTSLSHEQVLCIIIIILMLSLWVSNQRRSQFSLVLLCLTLSFTSRDSRRWEIRGRILSFRSASSSSWVLIMREDEEEK